MSAPGRSRLTALTRNLMQEWERTRESWRDAKAEEFEKDCLRELESGVNRTLHAMEKLDALLSRIRKDCSE